MLKVSFNVLSTSSALDSQTGSLSMFDVLEEIRTPQLPINLSSLVINIGLLKVEPKAFSGQVLIHQVNPDGQSGMIGKGNLQINSDQRKMKIVFRFNGLPFVQYGNYKFVVSVLDQSGKKILESISEIDCFQLNQSPPNLRSLN